MYVPCHVVGDQNCPQYLFFRELVWCSTLYIPCASQSHFVTLTGAINHTMDILSRTQMIRFFFFPMISFYLQFLSNIVIELIVIILHYVIES